MKIRSVGQNTVYSSHAGQTEEKGTVEGREQETAASIQQEEQKIYSTEKKVTYDKPQYKPDQATIAELKAASEQAHSQLIELIKRLLQRQGKETENFSLKTVGDITPDAIAVEEAQALIGPDGELGAEKTSDRIVEFAKALSGGDPEKIPALRAAIEKGFKEAEAILGGLPGVSQETYRLVQEKLDQWEASFAEKE